MRGQLKVVTPVSVVKCVPLPRRRSLARLHRELGLRGRVVCVVNGRPVLQRRRPRGDRFYRDSGWRRVPRRTDVVEFVILPQGGDRQGNKDIIRTVALLALVIAAPYAVGPAAGFGLGLTGFAATAASAAIVIGGSFLLNVLLPPGGAASADPSKTESASPTYNIDAQGNTARLNQPIPKQFGYHQMVPDFGARPWVRYYGNDQYLHTLLCCGLGEHQVHKIRMDRVDLWDEVTGNPQILDGVETQICQPGAPVTLFDTAIYTSPDVSNLEMRQFSAAGVTLGFINNTVGPGAGSGGSPIGINGFDVFRAGDEVVISGAGANNGTRFVQSVNLETQRLAMSGGNFATQGDVTGVTIALTGNITELGPFTCCPPGQTINLIEVDIVFPRGIGEYTIDGDLILTAGITVQFFLRIIDDFGTPLTGYLLAFQKTFNGKTTTPVRETFSGPIGPQRWEILGIRTTNNSSNPRVLNELVWTGFRGRMPHDNIYPDTTMVAIKMRASGQLSAQSSRMINVIQTAKVPVWNSINIKAVQFANGRYVSAGSVLQYERTQSWSAIAAIKLDSPPATACDIHANVDGAATRGITFLILSTGKLYIAIMSSAANNLQVVGSINLLDGKRHIVGYSYDGSSTPAGIKIYVDGVLDPSITIIVNNLSATIVNAKPFYIGNTPDDLARFVPGAIGYFRFSNIVRPASYFDQQIAEVDANTVLAYDFAEGTGTATNDLSASNFDGTLSTSAMWGSLPEWSAPVPNRSPAWAAAYIARTPIIGAGLPDSRSDHEGLLALDATWSARDDYFDGIFDRSFTVWDAIKAVTRVGRAQPIMVGGTLSVVRDEPGGFARGVFTPQNIRRGTFKTTHVLYDDSTPDDAIVSYMDETSWRNSDVRAMLPGSTSQAPANITAFGIINRNKAWQFGMYEAASNLYRRKFCSFNTDMEGKLILKSQPVLVGHDVPKWGSSGRLIDFDRPTRKLTFDEPIDWSYGGQYYVSLSQPNNQEWGPVMVTQGVDPDIAIMDASDFAAVEVAMGTIPFIDFDTAGGEQIRFVAGPSTKYAQRMKLVSSNPQAIDNVELNLVIDDDRVFDYENALPLPSGLPDPDTLGDEFSTEGLSNGTAVSTTHLWGIGGRRFTSQGTAAGSSTVVGEGET